MSGVLYPMLILILFLVLSVLNVMANRKNILDQNKKELLDSVNAANQVYTNEELSVLLDEQQKKLSDLETKYDAALEEITKFHQEVPIGKVDLFSGEVSITDTTWKRFHVAFNTNRKISNMFSNYAGNRVKLCMNFTTDGGQSESDHAFLKLENFSGTDPKTIIATMESKLWGNPNEANELQCTDYFDRGTLASSAHHTLWAKVGATPRTFTIYRVYLLVYSK